MKMKFLLDTNFLMVPGQFRVDVYDQLRQMGPAELYVSELSVKELDRLAKKRGRNAACARVAMLLLRREGVKVVPAGREKHADDAIRHMAVTKGMAVCTADRALKASLLRRKVPVVVLRQRKYLVI